MTFNIYNCCCRRDRNYINKRLCRFISFMCEAKLVRRCVFFLSLSVQRPKTACVPVHFLPRTLIRFALSSFHIVQFFLSTFHKVVIMLLCRLCRCSFYSDSTPYTPTHTHTSNAHTISKMKCLFKMISHKRGLL